VEIARRTGYVAPSIARPLSLGLALVVTGRGAAPELVAAADLVTEMRSVKHPLDHGARALLGVHY
jgi:ATP:corrinoid adenosyltransferase